MSSVRMPNRIYGKWIWKQSLMRHPDSVALLRREFSCSRAGNELTLWIAAINTYQLFLNGRLIGFGPRAHQSPDSVFIDQHDLTGFVENGVNVLTVLVACNTDRDNPARRPGFWCQLASPGHEILCSDESWLIRDGGEFERNRPRFSRNGGLTGVIQADKLPLEWQLPIFEPDASWTPPDLLHAVDQSGPMLELHPLPPPSISPESVPFSLLEAGKVSRRPVCSEVIFRQAPGDGRCYVGAGYIFCEQPIDCEVKIFSDDPFRFFCDNTQIAQGEWSDSSGVCPLHLRAGWNRLLLYQTPRYNAMGATFVFCGKSVKPIHVQQDMTMDAPDGWNTAGPLRMNLDECTAACHLDGLPLTPCPGHPDNMTDPGDLLREAVLTPAVGRISQTLGCDDYRIFRLDRLRYGFVRLELTAAADDVVDIVVGVRRSANRFVQAAFGVRGCSTLHCREGVNIFCSHTPADCFYLAVFVRRTKNGVAINSMHFDELVRYGVEEMEEFHCSDEELNSFWDAGKQTLRRSAAFIPVADADESNDCSMLDAYIDSANMAAVFGDADYIAFRLRRFVSMQYESGEIPLLTFGRRRGRQISQMFFLPVWINYNYRFSGNRVEFERSLESLNKACTFFESMIDDASGTLRALRSRFGIEDVLLEGIDDDDVPTQFNVLYCRFLLSAAESYQLAGNESAMRRCRRIANRIATALHQSSFNAAERLFADRRIGSEGAEETVTANFFAMFAGVLPLEEFEHFFFTFFTYEPPFEKFRESSPYFRFFFLEMLFSLDQRHWALGYFREYWKKRLCSDACAWTVPGSDCPAPTSFNGGGSISPNIFLLREVLGIRIADVGHSVVYFNPAFREVNSAEGTIPMAHGRLLVRWSLQPDGSLDVLLNSTVPIKVMPELSKKRLAMTSFRLGEQVTLLAPPEDFVSADDEEEES